MSVTQTTPFGIKKFQLCVLTFAFVLGGLAAWILAAEVMRPTTVEFTTQAQSAAASYQQRDAAMVAARIGRVRGDLWSEAAFAYGDTLWSEAKDGSTPDALFELRRTVIEQAIAYAPHNSRLWLLLAANFYWSDWLNKKAPASLRMSYYTGSSSVTVAPMRLLLAVQSRALQDDDFQELVRHDIQIAVARRSELMPTLISAYNKAPLAGRQFIEKTLAELDPSMLASVRAEKDHQ